MPLDNISLLEFLSIPHLGIELREEDRRKLVQDATKVLDILGVLSDRLNAILLCAGGWSEITGIISDLHPSIHDLLGYIVSHVLSDGTTAFTQCAQLAGDKKLIGPLADPMPLRNALHKDTKSSIREPLVRSASLRASRPLTAEGTSVNHTDEAAPMTVVVSNQTKMRDILYIARWLKGVNQG